MGTPKVQKARNWTGLGEENKRDWKETREGRNVLCHHPKNHRKKKSHAKNRTRTWESIPKLTTGHERRGGEERDTTEIQHVPSFGKPQAQREGKATKGTSEHEK